MKYLYRDGQKILMSQDCIIGLYKLGDIFNTNVLSHIYRIRFDDFYKKYVLKEEK